MKIEKITLKKAFLTVVTAVTCLIVLGALLLPFLVDKVPFLGSLYGFYHKLCIGASSQCFMINGSIMPLCARCLGIYSGMFLTMVLYWENIRIGHAFYIIFGVLGVGEFVLEHYHLIYPDNIIRFVAGLMIGVFIMVTILRMEIKFKNNY